MKAPIVEKELEKPIVHGSAEHEEFEEVLDEHGNLVK